jgi:hypothetical protein
MVEKVRRPERSSEAAAGGWAVIGLATGGSVTCVRVKGAAGVGHEDGVSCARSVSLWSIFASSLEVVSLDVV